MITRKDKKIEKGIRRHGLGFQTYIRVKGELYTETWPAGTPLETMRRWLAATKRQHFGGGARPPGSFAADIAEYCDRRAAMPTIGQVRGHLDRWAAALGRDRFRHSITTAEIDKVMNGWLIPDPPEPGESPAPGRAGQAQARGLDKQTVRKRRNTLRSFFEVMNAPGEPNPVQDAQNWSPKKAADRGTDYATIARVLAAMPDYQSTRKGLPRRVNLGKYRCAVLAYTGIPPGLLAELAPTAVDRTTVPPTLRLPGREKGDGVEGRVIPLSAEGAAAFDALAAVQGFGPFVVSALNASFKRACRRAGVHGLTLYDLRHSFGSAVYASTRDLATVGRLLGHAAGSVVTSRYTRSAHATVDAAAVAAFSVHVQSPALPAPLAAKPGRRRGRKLPAKVASKRLRLAR